MSKQKNIKLIKPWGMHLKGASLTLDAPIADLLVQSGRAEAVQSSEVKSKSSNKRNDGGTRK
jgi:hypothetical protein